VVSRKRAIWCGVLALAAVALVYVWPALGWGARGEFSPDTLQCRSQREWLLLPFTDVAVYRSSYDYYQNDLTRYLVDRGSWSPREAAAPRWIPLYHYNPQWRDGWSMLQHQVFKNHVRWIEWTEGNPEIAAVIWPHMLTILRDAKYDGDVYAVSMLEFASRVNDLEEFDREMAKSIDWPKDLPYLPEGWREKLEATGEEELGNPG